MFGLVTTNVAIRLLLDSIVSEKSSLNWNKYTFFNTNKLVRITLPRRSGAWFTDDWKITETSITIRNGRRQRNFYSTSSDWNIYEGVSGLNYSRCHSLSRTEPLSKASHKFKCIQKNYLDMMGLLISLWSFETLSDRNKQVLIVLRLN